MQDDRLPTKMWLQAGLALCSGRGISAMVLQSGDPHTGVVLVKIATLDGKCRLLTQQRDIDGNLTWMDALPSDATPDEADADAYIGRARQRDPDLWIVEIEDRSGANPFDSDH
ncbi:DUF1491 family protein [Rhodospirillaceae bacterium KN72]|uniref:DUF1491 family protein n=1 Tax=Pacificispira spongiicola TaxID=2729598 RepID=A0A7Y0DXN8_9PROT|nr:DUF1491 family protein [Pacificispira spongiicola]NMM43512.1 DUF1491 family protein [Pacificispira spongiicola]